MNRWRWLSFRLWPLLSFFLIVALDLDAAWDRHVIDDSSRGADGVRLCDVNNDGLLDIATGWEEGGITRAYLHPGYSMVKTAWPAVTVGRTESVEDAVFADLDSDGGFDVVSCCEGNRRAVLVHWAPSKPEDYLDEDAWITASFPAAEGVSMWMFAFPMQVDGKFGPDLIIGSKGENGVVGWLQSPEDPRDMEAWTFHPLRTAGWIMSMRSFDMDHDGDQDVLLSDRKGAGSGVVWLENPGSDAVIGAWNEHRIGADQREVMFLDVIETEERGIEIAAAVRASDLFLFRSPPDGKKDAWAEEVIDMGEGLECGNSKAAAWGDMDGDGVSDLVFSCEDATPPRSGVVWLKKPQSVQDGGNWEKHDISGPAGIKFDRIELYDLDGDADLDVLICEERHEGRGLGVVWYENPCH
jgi:hypothetical protein